ncbi:dipeptide ABC transporter ATP-binding protein [Dactylosporangium sp. CA-092794]|uniref:dipeptide ABC transporter ATP-binding protein n=1 Tax=Dactylosporangium sp. CA-092794 TaxID=3239929 RepID=UPI003D9381AC
MTASTDPVVLAVNGLRVAFADRDDPRRPARAAVTDVSFELRAGRVLALVGESGSGKSVTAMAALGLLPPSARVTGSVRLEGEELVGARPGRLRRVRGGRIGTIFQEPMSAFNPAYTIGWQIAEALRTHGAPARGRRLRERVAELLRSAGLPDAARIARSHPHELSGGQLQRSMIAMAISCDPVALIADEPTTALDVTVQAGILDLLRTLRATRGTAILLITHDMGVVADLADDVVVMRGGEVVERADARTVFAAPARSYTRELLDAVPRLDRLRADAGGAAPEAALGEAIAEVRGARIVYGGDGWGRRRTVAVDGVDLRIVRGRTLGLVGESGSGKSTLGRALAGLVGVREGAVRVGGTDLARASGAALRAVRRRIGYVFQDPASSLDPRYPVGRVIDEPMRLLSELPAAARAARVAELLDAVQLPAGYARRYPHELSGGQRQRVAIARALALRPDLLIADEPTSALDVSVQARVLDLLVSLRAEFGFACLFISHDLGVVHRLAHDVAVMRAGRIVEAGPADAVLRSPRHPYTLRLLAAAPVADPDEQRVRRAAWRSAAEPPATLERAP